jgi:hypothetical protein
MNFACTTLHPANGTQIVPITFIKTTVILHTGVTVEYDIRVPVVIIAKVLFDRRLECFYKFLNFEKVFDGWSFLLNLKLEHR